MTRTGLILALSLLLLLDGCVYLLRRRWLHAVVLIVLAFVFGIAGPGTDYWCDLYWGLNRPQVTAELTLMPGGTVKTFVEQAEQKGLIVSAGRLAKVMTQRGLDRSLRPGSYEVQAGSARQIVDQLVSQKPKMEKITLLPGALPFLPFGEHWTRENQRAALADDRLWPAELLPRLSADVGDRVAFLAPETYTVVKASLPLAVNEASAFWYKTFNKDVANLTSTELQQAAVVASLVEREGLLTDEFPRIAGVIYNRLRRAMPLQIDATIVFAWRLKGQDLNRVLYKHLELDSPYNTYKYTGLPPHPICVPGIAAWKAALHPEQHDYLYYVAAGDGSHKFSQTEAEHARAVAEYRSRRK